VDIAAALEISVIAEGVETLAHAQILADLGVDTLQGFHFARPMTAADFKKFISKKMNRVA
jgi:EAL domain-containing protein (putative c-di-GMP-specific phosphodiesterase class I)